MSSPAATARGHRGGPAPPGTAVRVIGATGRSGTSAARDGSESADRPLRPCPPGRRWRIDGTLSHASDARPAPPPGGRRRSMAPRRGPDSRRAPRPAPVDSAAARAPYESDSYPVRPSRPRLAGPRRRLAGRESATPADAATLILPAARTVALRAETGSVRAAFTCMHGARDCWRSWRPAGSACAGVPGVLRRRGGSGARCRCAGDARSASLLCERPRAHAPLGRGRGGRRAELRAARPPGSAARPGPPPESGPPGRSPARRTGGGGQAARRGFRLRAAAMQQGEAACVSGRGHRGGGASQRVSDRRAAPCRQARRRDHPRSGCTRRGLGRRLVRMHRARLAPQPCSPDPPARAGRRDLVWPGCVAIWRPGKVAPRQSDSDERDSAPAVRPRDSRRLAPARPAGR